MSGAENRLPIFPTRGALVTLKSRISSATRGHALLKRKVEALQYRFRKIFANLISTKIAIAEAVKDAAISLAEMRFVTGEMISPVIIETASKASTKIRTRNENIAGIKITVFESYQEGNDAYEFAGLSRGGQQLAAVKIKFLNIINLVTQLASLQTSFLTFDDTLKVTNRRVAGIEHIVLPRLRNTLKYFDAELEEFDREEFYRIKKLKEKKQRKNYCNDYEREPQEGVLAPHDPKEALNFTKCICHM